MWKVVNEKGKGALGRAHKKGRPFKVATSCSVEHGLRMFRLVTKSIASRDQLHTNIVPLSLLLSSSIQKFLSLTRTGRL